MTASCPSFKKNRNPRVQSLIFVKSNEDLTVEQVYAPPKSGPPSKRNLKKKSSTKIKPPSPPPIKEPTPPESSSSGEEQPVVPVITPAPVIPSTPPEAPVIPPAPLSPPKFASLAKNMYPMPNALPTRPVCSDEGRVTEAISKLRVCQEVYGPIIGYNLYYRSLFISPART